MYKFLSRIFGAEKVLPLFPGIKHLKLQNLDLELKLSQQNISIKELDLKNSQLSEEKYSLVSGISQQKIKISELTLKNDHLTQEKESLSKENKNKMFQIEKQSKENITLDKEIALLKQERNYNLNEIQRLMSGNENKLNDLTGRLETLIDKNSNVKSSYQIGEDGENFVLSSLESAFPNNTGIFKTNGNFCGDILFKLENDQNSFIMFEVKNYQKSSGTISKEEIKKFFNDLNNCAASGDICGGVFVSLNGPVDFNTTSLEPKFDLESGKPYIFIDSMKEQFPDAQCLMKVVVHVMTYLIKNSNKIKDEESYNMKLENYQSQTKDLIKTINTLERTQTKHLSKLKDGLDSLHKVIMADQKTLNESKESANENAQKLLNGDQKFISENAQEVILDGEKKVEDTKEDAIAQDSTPGDAQEEFTEDQIDVNGKKLNILFP